MNKYIRIFVGGVVLGTLLCVYGVYAQGPDALIMVGTKWQAAQRSYTVYSMPAMAEDEERVAEAPKRITKRAR